MDDNPLDLPIPRSSWPQVRNWSLAPATRGANNLTLRVGDNDFILRVHRNHADERRLRHELGVVMALTTMDLPFLVPAPIPTATGEIWSRVTLADGGDALATLWPFVKGVHPERRNPVQARAAGQALGLLDHTLARVALPVHSESDMPPPMFERALHAPADVDIPTVLAGLSLREGTVERVLALMASVEEVAPAILAALPTQLIHSDFDPSNVLMEGERVRAILDFEFATVDARVAELGAPLMWWPVEVFGTGREWPIIGALLGGYFSARPLTSAETAALPLILRIRYLGSMVHRIMRYVRDLTSLEEVTARVESTLQRDEWLAANTARLVEQAVSWGK